MKSYRYSLLFGALQLACIPSESAAQGQVPPAQGVVAPKAKAQELTPQQKELDALLKKAAPWRSWDRAAAVKNLEAKVEIIENVSRQRLHGVTMIRNPAKYPATFYYRGDEQVLMTLSGATLVGQFRDTDMFAVLPGTPTTLRSAFGKTSAVFVYPELGVSFTTRREDSHTIQLIEIFRPRSMEEYKQTIYEEPSYGGAD